MSVESIADKWFRHLISADPINHDRAQAAVGAAYAAAGLPEPTRFLWCSSPLEAVWAYLVLVGRAESYNHAVCDDVERSKLGKQKLPEVRAATAGRLDISDSQLEGGLGKPFYRAEGTNPISRKLQESMMDSWMARADGGDAFLAPHAGGPFKPLHDLEFALHFEGERRGTCSLYREALAAAANKPLAILGGRSAQHRLYGNLAYLEVAIDEALAEAGKFEPTELQRALWAAYQVCGLWWPCEQGVVFAERPAAGELAPDGPRMRWADGFTVGGVPAPKSAQAPQPDPPERKPAALFDRPLPADRAARIEYLRSLSPALPLFDRYLAGDHRQVWKDLMALGDQALGQDHAADAAAVAYETMERVAGNVRTLADRLQGLGYRFVYPGSDGGFFGLRKARAHEPHVPPATDVSGTISAIEQAIGGPLPLSLRAFFEVVGEVNFNGDHPSIAPPDSEVAPDPLMVCSAEEALAMLESEDFDDEDGSRIEFAPDALHKANVSGGSPYSIAVPNPAADALVEDGPRGVTFVEYLRTAILAWGGFPGWEDAKQIPAELDDLRRDLVPF